MIHVVAKLSSEYVRVTGWHPVLCVLSKYPLVHHLLYSVTGGEVYFRMLGKSAQICNFRKHENS